MDAIEYVKRYGISRTILDLSIVDKHGYNSLFTDDFTKKLKKIVNAFDLVEIGLHELKKSMFSNSKDLDYVKNWLLTVSEKLLTEKWVELKKAVELVEKCNER